MKLPLEELADAVRRKVRRPLFASACGPHLYGYAWPSAPFHVRGAMLLPLREVLGLRPAEETKERHVAAGPFDVMLTFHDLRPYLDMLARAANTAALEDLQSPHVVLTGPAHERLRRSAAVLLTRLAYHDFRQRAAAPRERLAAGPALVIDLVEAARLHLCGTTALLAGRIESDVGTLLESHGALWLRPFVARVRQEGDAARLEEGEAKLLLRELDALAARLSAAHDRSALHDGVGSITSLDELLVDLRLRDLEETR